MRKMVTVLYYLDTARAEMDVIGVFDDENPGTGKIHTAKAMYRLCNPHAQEHFFCTVDRVVNHPECTL